jgi:hypothetical protein
MSGGGPALSMMVIDPAALTGALRGLGDGLVRGLGRWVATLVELVGAAAHPAVRRARNAAVAAFETNHRMGIQLSSPGF